MTLRSPTFSTLAVSDAMKTFLLLGVCSVIAANLAYAQYTGPSNQVVLRTIADILKDPKDDQAVVLTGHVVRQVGKEKYIFKDATGEIRVEIDRELLPGAPFNESSKVEISGEVEKDFLQSPELDIDSIRLL